MFFEVSQSSDSRDMILKQYIEQIFTDLHLRIRNHQQEEEECSTNTTVVVGAD